MKNRKLLLTFLFVSIVLIVALSAEAKLPETSVFYIEYSTGPYTISSEEPFSILIKLVDSTKKDKIIQQIDGEYFSKDLTVKLGRFSPVESDAYIDRNTGREFTFSGMVSPEVIAKALKLGLKDIVLNLRLVGINVEDKSEFAQVFPIYLKMPEDEKTLLKLKADANYFAGYYEDSVKYYREVLEISEFKRDSMNLFKLIISEINAGEWDPAIQDTRQYIKKRVKNEQIREILSSFNFRTFELLNEGRIEEAKKINNFVLELQKKKFKKDKALNISLLLVDSLILYQLGDLQASLDVYTKTLNSKEYISNYSDYYLHGAILYLSLERRGEGYKAFGEYLSYWAPNPLLNELRYSLFSTSSKINPRNPEDIDYLLFYLLFHFKVEEELSLSAFEKIDGEKLSFDLQNDYQRYNSILKDLSDTRNSQVPVKDDGTRRRILFFSGTDCGYCKFLKIYTLRNPEVHEALKPFIFHEINGDKDTESVARYNVIGFPTLILLNEAGIEIDRQEGFVTPNTLLYFLNREEKTGFLTFKELELLVQDNPGSPDLVSALCFRYLNRNNTVKANTLAQSFHKISNQSPEINYILYLTTIDEKLRAEYIAQAFSLVSKTDEYLARAIFREYIGYLSVTDKITEIPNAAESFLGSHTIDASDPAWDFLLRMLQLNGSISILQRVLKDNQVLPQDRVLYNYCNLLSTKEDGVEVLKNFGKLNQYLEQEIFTGLNLYKKNNGYLPDEIDYIGKRPMDPLTYNYLLYERSVNKVDAVFQLYEPERYYLKFWKYSYLRGLNFSSL